MVVTLVELKDIQLPDAMKPAMARQGEALADAPAGGGLGCDGGHPLALQLRTLQTLVEIGVDNSTMVVVPAPWSAPSRSSAGSRPSRPPPPPRRGGTGQR
jgi:hypothetical protein